jgi:hypothetical protein
MSDTAEPDDDVLAPTDERPADPAVEDEESPEVPLTDEIRVPVEDEAYGAPS